MTTTMTTMTTRDAATLLGIQQRSVIQLIRRGLLRAVKVGRDYHIAPDEVARYGRERRPAHRPRKEA